jgi:uncharacterized membrane protein
VRFSLCNIYLFVKQVKIFFFSNIYNMDIQEEQITDESTKETKKIDDMTFEELKTYTKKLKENKKKYIRKYQKTDKGKATTRIASQKYYKKKDIMSFRHTMYFKQ